MDINAKEQHILSTVDALWDDIVDFTQRLVAEPSTLGNEASVMVVMENELQRLGLHPEKIPIDAEDMATHPGFAPVPWNYENRYNLVATEPAAGAGGRSALLNGHLDVVSPTPDGLWQQDPFAPVIRDGWLYGRGAGDMKSGVAAMVYALHAVKKAGFGLKAPVSVETVIEEECSGNGALACIAAGYDADAVLIPEPFGPTILTHQVGVAWFKVTVKGVPSHVLEAPAGTNAIEKIYPVIDGLRRLESELNAADIPAAYDGINHPINLNIGIIKGGDWPSTVPAEAVFHGRLSYFPGVGYNEICRKIEQAVEQAAHNDSWLAENPPEVEFYGFRSDGHGVSGELPALRTLNDSHRALTGRAAAEYIATCTTDLRAFIHFGTGQATCYGPVAENIHAANERVNLDSVMQVARTYALFLARWCGLAE
jgi:acetylornithine deacetylase